MRKGFSLIEMLVIVIITPFIFLIFDGLFKTLASDIPWSWRIAQENTTMLNMLDQLQQDIDAAKGLPESFGGHTVNDNLLLIELPNGVLCYQLKGGRVLRQRFAGTDDSKPEDEKVWSLPNAKLEWHCWTRDGRRYAVETSACVERSARGQWKKKMAHSHLYFVGAF